MKLRNALYTFVVVVLAWILIPGQAWGDFQQDIAHIWNHIRTEYADKRYVQLQDESYLKRDPAPYCTALANSDSYGPCTAVGSAEVTLEKSPNIGGVSLAIGRDGNPVISYLSGRDLRVAKCNDRNCTGNNERVSTVQVLLPKDQDGTSDRIDGEGTSIAVAADGLPVIAVGSKYVRGLRIVKCNDAACSGANERSTTLFTPMFGRVGEYPSIAIGDNGFPVIAFYNRPKDFMQVMPCNDPACSGGDDHPDWSRQDDAKGTSIAALETGFVVAHIKDGGTEVVHHGPDGYTNTIVSEPDFTFNTFDSSAAVVAGWDGNPLLIIGRVSSLGPFETTALRCRDPKCAGRKVSSFGGDSGFNGAPSVAISHRGLPVVARVLDRLTVGNCVDAGCAVDGRPEVEIGSTKAAAPSLAIGTDGRTNVAYVDGGLVFVRVPS